MTICANLQASSRTVQSDTWTELFFQSKPLENSKWLYTLQFQNRFRDKSPAQKQGLIRPAIGYQFLPHISAFVGYTALPTVNSNSQTRYQQDIFEQLFFDTTIFNNVQAQMWWRLEQRFNSEASGEANRFRNWMNVYIPVYHDWLRLQVFEEVFFNLNHPAWVSQSTFSENRVYLGLNIRVSNRTFVNIGYKNRQDFSPNQTVVTNIAFLGLRVLI